MMTSGELQDLIIAHLVREGGGTKRQWRLALGPVRAYSRETHGHCNWDCAPSGSAGQNALIERMLDDLRLRYPFVAG